MTPIKSAHMVLHDFKVTTTPALSLNKIFEHYKIIYDEMEYNNPNFMGSLIRAEGETIILVNTDIKNVGRINFTKAHELGHYCLNHHGEQFECLRTDLLDFTRKPMEIEANQFAQEFLMPEHMVKPICFTAPFDFQTIKGISDYFLVSKLAAVFRILEYHSGNYAFIYSKDGVITHSKVSSNLMGKVAIRYPGEQIDSKSYAFSLLYGKTTSNDYTTINSSIWIRKNHTSQKIAVKEFSRANKASRTVMTLLKIKFI
ncbi:ImmA/IrrE family metallo-endopeptidase [Paenibacillus sp. GYB003]|uniref:ImmA/IrrE family metallo-endopeptidase n=1 Tax=Paenibacillus sp. GYB003 TaxID=2994392 RepID=UPI002F9690EC